MRKLIYKKGGIIKCKFGSSLPTREQIVSMVWQTENPNHRGRLPNGLYQAYDDPNGEDLNVGPGLKVGDGIGRKKYYTRQELEDAAYQFGLDSLNAIAKSYNDYYGTNDNPTPFNDVDHKLKLLMLDTRYQNGRLPQEDWPSLYEAVKNGDIIEALRQSRSTFTRDGQKHYDNDRVRRRADSLWSNLYNVRSSNIISDLPIVTLINNNI